MDAERRQRAGIPPRTLRRRALRPCRTSHPAPKKQHKKERHPVLHARLISPAFGFRPNSCPSRPHCGIPPCALRRRASPLLHFPPRPEMPYKKERLPALFARRNYSCARFPSESLLMPLSLWNLCLLRLRTHGCGTWTASKNPARALRRRTLRPCRTSHLAPKKQHKKRAAARSFCTSELLPLPVCIRIPAHPVLIAESRPARSDGAHFAPAALPTPPRKSSKKKSGCPLFLPGVIIPAPGFHPDPVQ